MDTAPLASQNPLSIVSFLLVEFQNLKQIDQLYAHFGAAGFVDVTSDATAAGEWATLELTASEFPYLLAFNALGCNGELELIFSDGRLVQGGFLLVGEPADTPSLQRLFDAVRAILHLRFHIANVSPTHLMFSNNIVNGYLRTPDAGRLAFRVAELRWCETMYGPLDRTE